MINVYPIKPNNRKAISFKENPINNRTSSDGLRALQNPRAMVEFQKNMALTRAADAVQSNPFTALYYKVVKMIKLIARDELSAEQKEIALYA